MNISPELKKLVGPIEGEAPEIQLQIISLIQKMISLGFVAKFVKLEEGPIVRTYYFEPAATSPLSKILQKEDDLALSISVESVLLSRDKGYITIAVPRNDRQIIQFDKALLKLLQQSKTSDMILPILMGQTPQGEDFYLDLAAQPHLLIAGATNSGKSIFTSQLICSLALLHPPEILRFHLVDTKQLDLTLFAGLPHIGQVIKDVHSLRTCLEELIQLYRERTSKMSGFVRNINEWNKQNPDAKMQYQVLIIDEFADVIDNDKQYLASLPPTLRPTSIEALVKQLAQVCRAVGIHIVIATQRPSVKVVSGDIKTNFPARICFKLPSMQDSRVILDENGAERLLGKGDYLYKTATSESIRRGHSAYVSTNDIALIITQSEFLRKQYIGE